jgi:hypothetical protein
VEGLGSRGHESRKFLKATASSGALVQAVNIFALGMSGNKMFRLLIYWRLPGIPLNNIPIFLHTLLSELICLLNLTDFYNTSCRWTFERLRLPGFTAIVQ